jgi:solute carrier family 13 (sodium-dependent dicarboxylate transporter), member 2/3/5
MNPLRVLLVDDESDFRKPLAERLELRGYAVQDVESGELAVRCVRADRNIDVVLLDYRMPGMDGLATLQEIKTFRPEIPVIMLTAFGSVETATRMGKLGVYRFLPKPIGMEELVDAIDAAAREKTHALARLDMPTGKSRHWRNRLRGSHNLRPGVILCGLLILLACMTAPLPRGLETLLTTPKTGDARDVAITGYPGYREMLPGDTIASHTHRTTDTADRAAAADAEGPAKRAMLMIGLIFTAAMFWATGAVPLGITAMIVAVVMSLGGVMGPDHIAQAFAKDSVVFIFGVLVMSRVITGTGLDRRIAMLLLLPVRNLPLMLFVFLPLFALTCSLISESILIALMMPVFVTVFQQVSERDRGDAPLWENRQLLVMFALMLCYASNVGGPGSPAAGGRNAVMISILADYDMAPTFLQWMTYGMPFVPVAGLVVGLYFFIVFRRRINVESLDVAAIARHSCQRLGPMNRDEYLTAGVFALVIGLWIFGGERLGMGAPVLLGLVLLNVFGVMKWRAVTKIHWDVVFLYAGASALGKGLAVTGGALYLARGLVDLLPGSGLDGVIPGGVALPIAVSFLTGIITNIMSDGAAVAAIGPVTVPMAHSAGIHPWAVGFATAFASSFPHMLIIGTPANALVYILCKDPHTGRQLVTQGDFLRHGAAVFILSFIVLWFWAILGYWRWLGF